MFKLMGRLPIDRWQDRKVRYFIKPKKLVHQSTEYLLKILENQYNCKHGTKNVSKVYFFF